MSLVDRFRMDGVVAVPAAFTMDHALVMKDTIWRRIETNTTARRDNPASWHDVTAPSFKPLKRHSAFRAVPNSPALGTALDDIFGAGRWEASASGVQVLFTFPNAAEWTVPHHLWHMDCDFERTEPTTMVKVFCCVDRAAPGGGATLVLAGSHRLVDRYSIAVADDGRMGNAASWRRFLDTYEWTRDLITPGIDQPARTHRYLSESGDVDGVPLRLLEMTGEPGDVHITDIHTFHCVAPNALDRPRIMLGCLFRRTSPADDLAPENGGAKTGAKQVRLPGGRLFTCTVCGGDLFYRRGASIASRPPSSFVGVCGARSSSPRRHLVVDENPAFSRVGHPFAREVARVDTVDGTGTRDFALRPDWFRFRPLLPQATVLLPVDEARSRARCRPHRRRRGPRPCPRGDRDGLATVATDSGRHNPSRLSVFCHDRSPLRRRSCFRGSKTSARKWSAS